MRSAAAQVAVAQLDTNVNRTATTLEVEGIEFVGSSPTWKPTSEQALHKAKAILDSYPSIRVSIEGHAHSKEKSPKELSLRRAQQIREWLVKQGVPAYRLEVRGYGATRPVTTNLTPKGRARNARVEFIVIDDSILNPCR